MTAPRALPGLSLTAYYTRGADGWDDTFNPDMQKLSAFVQCSVISRVTALPGSPTDGDMYIVPSDAVSNANQLAIRDDGAWAYFTPPYAGFIAFVRDEAEHKRWSGASWQPFTGDLPTADEVLYDSGDTGDSNSAKTTVSDALDDLYARTRTGPAATAVSYDAGDTGDSNSTQTTVAAALDDLYSRTRALNVYRVGFAATTPLGASESLGWHVFGRACSLAALLAGIAQLIDTVSTGATDLTIQKRYAAGGVVNIGTLSTNGGTAFTGGITDDSNSGDGDIDFVAGDAIRVLGQVSPDATLTFSLTFTLTF